MWLTMNNSLFITVAFLSITLINLPSGQSDEGIGDEKCYVEALNSHYRGICQLALSEILKNSITDNPGGVEIYSKIFYGYTFIIWFSSKEQEKELLARNVAENLGGFFTEVRPETKFGFIENLTSNDPLSRTDERMLYLFSDEHLPTRLRRGELDAARYEELVEDFNRFLVDVHRIWVELDNERRSNQANP